MKYSISKIRVDGILEFGDLKEERKCSFTRKIGQSRNASCC